MRRVLLALLGWLALAGCGGEPAPPAGPPGLSPEAVERQIAELERVIVPPKGTAKADVDAVFGVPTEHLTPRGKANPSRYPMHSYSLLPAPPRLSFRAVLHVSYREGRGHYFGINHVCVMKGRSLGGSAEEQAEIRGEKRCVLADLLLIREKFDAGLRSAPWNRPVPPDPPAGEPK